MAYKVVRRFKDLKHGGHIYEVGDVYPKKGKRTSNARIEELAKGKNKYNQIYIKEVEKE
jgi:hypothetical protein